MTEKNEELVLGDKELLQQIADRKITDDANLNDSQRRSARFLYTNGYIDAAPVEGSDAAIDALWLTDKGKEVLGLAGMGAFEAAVQKAADLGEEYDRAVCRVELVVKKAIEALKVGNVAWALQLLEGGD